MSFCAKPVPSFARHALKFGRRHRAARPYARYLPGAAGLRAAIRQRSEQKRTSSQTRSHFLRHVNGRWHCAQIFWGKSPLRRIFAIVSPD
jgi:hypothetical protein